MPTIQYQARTEAETDDVAARLAAILPHDATICLNGTLGAGKTRLVQAIAEARGIHRTSVVSPTFTLCNEYRDESATLYHLDLYRIADESELIEIGFAEYCDSDHLTFIEWADRFPAQLPEDRIDIDIEVIGPTARQFTVQGFGEWAALPGWPER